MYKSTKLQIKKKEKIKNRGLRECIHRESVDSLLMGFFMGMITFQFGRNFPIRSHRCSGKVMGLGRGEIRAHA